MAKKVMRKDEPVQEMQEQETVRKIFAVFRNNLKKEIVSQDGMYMYFADGTQVMHCNPTVEKIVEE